MLHSHQVLPTKSTHCDRMENLVSESVGVLIRRQALSQTFYFQCLFSFHSSFMISHLHRKQLGFHIKRNLVSTAIVVQNKRTRKHCLFFWGCPNFLELHTRRVGKMAAHHINSLDTPAFTRSTHCTSKSHTCESFIGWRNLEQRQRVSLSSDAPWLSL